MSLPREIPKTSDLLTPIPVRHDTARGAASPTERPESTNELTNFAQSLFYSSLGRPAAAITQLTDAVFPNLLPHLELTPPPSSTSVGGFVGDAVGNFVDLMVLSRLNKMPAFVGKFTPMVQTGETVGLNSLLTPVYVAPGESFWQNKVFSTGRGLAEGAALRGLAGKIYSSKYSPLQLDLLNYGAASLSSATSDAFAPSSDSPFKPLHL